MSRRGATSLAGILLLDKPAGMTSHDVVAAVRQATGEGRVGHAGTLDPMATGLLLVLVGPYTRLEPYLSCAEKSYDAAIAFGEATDTGDACGATVETAPVPEWLFEDTSRAQREVVDSFLGPSMQVPPAYSAIKVCGTTAHRAARAGAPLVLAPRPIDVVTAEIQRVDRDTRTWDVRFRVSKGTYIRSLARDIGEAAGTVAHLTALRRTGSLGLVVDDALTLDEVTSAAAAGNLSDLFVDALRALPMPAVEGDAARIARGRTLPLRPLSPVRTGELVAVTVRGELAGVYRVAEDALVPEVVLLREEVS